MSIQCLGSALVKRHFTGTSVNWKSKRGQALTLLAFSSAILIAFVSHGLNLPILCPDKPALHDGVARPSWGNSLFFLGENCPGQLIRGRASTRTILRAKSVCYQRKTHALTRAAAAMYVFNLDNVRADRFIYTHSKIIYLRSRPAHKNKGQRRPAVLESYTVDNTNARSNDTFVRLLHASVDCMIALRTAPRTCLRGT